MAERLIVADSESTVAFLKAYYGDDSPAVLCRAPLFSTTHQPVSGKVVKDGFRFAPLPAAKDLVTALAEYREKEILLAFEADTVGEMTCWQIDGYASQIGIRPDKIKRLKPSAFSKDEIESSFKAIAPPDVRQGHATYCRQLFDECLARHLHRLLGTNRGPGNLPLGHNTLATLFLLAERQQEQRMARHLQKWQIQGAMEVNGTRFTANLTEGLDLPAHGLFSDKGKAMALINGLGKYPFVVDGVSSSSLAIPPPAPYSLPELAQDAFTRLGLAPNRTTEIVSTFYHGIAAQGSTTGLITSPFPETPPPTAATLATLRECVSTLYGSSQLGECPELAAGAIVPLQPTIEDPSLAHGLGQDEIALYQLIRTRAIASQLRPAVGESLTVDFLVGKEHIFQSRFHDIIDHGFLQVLPEQLRRWQAPCPIPDVEEGQNFQAAIICQQSAMGDSNIDSYSLESLLDALTDFSISPEPLTIAMIGELSALGYLFLTKEGLVEASPQTAKVTTILGRAFPKMAGLNLSAYIEQTINEATSGRKDLAFALKQFDQTLMLHGKVLVKAKIPLRAPSARAKSSSTIIKPTGPRPVPRDVTPSLPPSGDQTPPLVKTRPLPEEPTIEAPIAEPLLPEPSVAAMAEHQEETAITVAEDESPAKDGQEEKTLPEIQSPPEDLLKLFADAIAETAQETEDAVPPAPSAPFAAQPPEPNRPPAAEAPGKSCPDCGRAMAIKEDQFGTYWGCSGFPVCRHSEGISLAAQELPCPLCGQVLSRKQTATGKEFFACPNDACQFMSWSLPHYLPCGLCDSPYLIEKSARGIVQLHCPRAGCPYAQPIPEASPESPPPEPANAAATQPTTAAKPTMKKILVRRSGTKGVTSGTGTKKVRIVRRRA